MIDNKQKESVEAMAELENIDGQADKVGIAMVKINDLELVAEFGLGKLPQLVYYRHTTPIVYDGMLKSLIAMFDLARNFCEILTAKVYSKWPWQTQLFE